jgi:pimeloyl-ACP methyl ester carboxylesterase
VIVHGMWMKGVVYALLAHRLSAQGFAVRLYSYPSVAMTLEDNVRRLEAFIARCGARRLHFVGHSLGGLVVLALLARDRDLPVGRVVLLGSPCAGCAAADQLLHTRSGRALVGRSLPQWRPQLADQVAQRVEIGAIAGTTRFGIGSLLVRVAGAGDGVVAVDETKRPGFTDHLALPVSHSGMVVSARVARQVGAFLRAGRFADA